MASSTMDYIFNAASHQRFNTIVIIIELTHSKAILKNTVEIEPQPVPLDFQNLSQYSSRSR